MIYKKGTRIRYNGCVGRVIHPFPTGNFMAVIIDEDGKGRYTLLSPDMVEHLPITKIVKEAIFRREE